VAAPAAAMKNHFSHMSCSIVEDTRLSNAAPASKSPIAFTRAVIPPSSSPNEMLAVEAIWRIRHTSLPGQDVAARIVAEPAAAILALDERINTLDKQITAAFRTHPQAKVIESLPGIGPILGAELVVAAGDLGAYRDAGHLASAAGLVPVPRDSGRRTGNLHRPKRYSRLRRIFYLSAQTSIIRPGPSRDSYLKKRAQGLKHIQAVIALARRRASVLWALLRDNRPFTPIPPTAQTA